MAYSSSLWEHDSFLKYNYIIIGSGITGLSAACSLLEHQAHARVLILERGLLPSGASTRNAGFACFGSPGEILSDLKIMNENEVMNLVASRYQGLQLLRKRLGDEALGFEEKGGHEPIPNGVVISDAELHYLNDLLAPIFNGKVFTRKTNLLTDYGLNKKYFSDLIFNPFEAQIHSGKMMEALLKKAASLGAKIITGCMVEKLEETNIGMSVIVHDHHNHSMLTFKADKVAVCTNGFAKQFFPDKDILPARGQVLVSEKIPHLLVNGTFHVDEGYIYFRDVEGRLLIGGARNLDILGEQSTEFEANEKIISFLKQFAIENILHQRECNFEFQWSGIMGVGANKIPIIEQVSDKIIAGIRMGGMGVALGTSSGEKVAKLLAN